MTLTASICQVQGGPRGECGPARRRVVEPGGVILTRSGAYAETSLSNPRGARRGGACGCLHPAASRRGRALLLADGLRTVAAGGDRPIQFDPDRTVRPARDRRPP